MPDFHFKPEAKQFFDTLSQFRTPEDQVLIFHFAAQLDVAGYDSFVIIPAYAKEPGLYEALKAHALAEPPGSCLYIVFINGNEYLLSTDEFEQLARLREAEVDRAAADFPVLKLRRFTYHFPDKAIISRIRGVMTDAVLKRCFEQNVEEPVIISNDADALVYSTGYVNSMVECFRRNPQIDYASGPIWWSGCEPSGRVCYSPSRALPEVYLNDFLGQFGDAIFRQSSPVYTTGCNSAFRGASLCGIRSYNYTFAPSYDLEIGRFFNLVREKVFGEDPKPHGGFVEQCALTTNPRRAVIASLGDVPFGMQFDNFGTVIGADIGLAECISAYEHNAKMLQVGDLLNLSDEETLEKVRWRIIRVFLHFLSGEPTDNRKKFAQLIAPQAGLSLLDVETDGKFVTNMTVDWANSPLLQKLVDWAERNVQLQAAGSAHTS